MSDATAPAAGSAMPEWNPDADPGTWRERFRTGTPFTIGVEEEVMLLDPERFDLAPRAEEVLARLTDESRISPELHAAQLELVTPPCANVPDAIAQLREARTRLVEETTGWLRVATAGVHPFAERAPNISTGERYRVIAAEYGRAALEAAVFGIHVHVAIDGADRAVAIHDAIREHLPTIAVLSGNGPFHAGHDTTFATMRPKLSEVLPRQGMPPEFGSWERWCEFVRWGQRSHTFGPQELWWEVRLHPAFGTLEVRVADAQCALDEAAGIVALIHALVRHLSDRYDDGTLADPVRTEVAQENRWRALRHGLGGTLLDGRTGTPRSSRQRVRELIALVEPEARELGCSAELAHAATLAECNGAERQRQVADSRGLTGLVSWMADRFDGRI
ncbi:MAG: YbdK family carboxylate-amine ligase [Patulibacter minatonensis]